MGRGLGYAMLAINCAFLLLIGYFARKQIKTADDFMVAGRRVKWPLISGSIVITWAWASTVLAAGEATYKYGWPAVWLYPISGLGLIVAAPFFAKIRKTLTGGATFTQYVKVRFGSRVHKVMVFVGLFINLILFMYLLTGLGWGYSPLFGLTYWEGVVYGGITVMIFVMLGGLWSSVMADYFQYLILWISMAIALIYGFKYIGGMGPLFDSLSKLGIQQNYAIYTKYSLYDYGLVLLFGWITYAVSDQTMWQRAYAIENPKDTKKTFVAGWVSWSLLPAMGALIALIGMSIGVEAKAGSDIMANIITVIAPDWVKIAWSFLVFNAIASTFGSVLVGTAAIIINDIYKSYFAKGKKIDDNKMIKLNKITILILGVIAILISLKPGSLLTIGIYLSGFLIVNGLPILMTYFISDMNKNSVFWAVIFAFLSNITLSTAVNFGYLTHIGSIKIELWHVYAFILLSEFLIVFIGSKVSPGEKLSFEDIGKLAEQQLRN